MTVEETGAKENMSLPNSGENVRRAGQPVKLRVKKKTNSF